MNDTLQMSRVRLMSTLNVDDASFESLLDAVNIEDADSFSDDEVRALKSAYVAQNSSSNRNRTPSVRSLSAAPSLSMGVTPGESVSPVDALRQHLQANVEQIKVQSDAALDEYDRQLELLMTNVCQEVQAIQGHWTGEGFRGLMHSGFNTIETSSALSLPQSQG